MTTNLLRAHIAFNHRVPSDLEFLKSRSIADCEKSNLDGQLTLWLQSSKEFDTWVYKAFYSLTGDYGHYFDAPYTFETRQAAKEHAIAVGTQIQAYLDDVKTRLRCPASLAPVTTSSGHFFNQEETERRILKWYFLNISQLSDDITVIAPQFERDRVSGFRLRFLWVEVNISFNRIRLRIDYNISSMIYHAYGLGYGLTASEIRNLANEYPF